MDSYKESIFEPLEYYRDRAKAEHAQNTSEYFEDLVSKSKINVEENRATVKKYYEETAEIRALTKKLNKEKAKRTLTLVFSIVLFVIALIVSYVVSMHISLKIIIPLTVLAIGIAATVLVFKSTKNKIASLSAAIESEERIAANLKATALI